MQQNVPLQKGGMLQLTVGVLTQLVFSEFSFLF